MKSKITDASLCDCRNILDLKDEISIECDVHLPEYCPDIFRIVYQKTNCVCASCHINASEAIVEGQAGITVCYQSETGQLKKIDYTMPFKKSYDLREKTEKTFYYCTARENYIKCKANSKRWLTINGSISITCLAFSCRETQALSASEDEDISLKIEEKEILSPYKETDDVITMREEILLPNGKPPIEEILSIEAVAIPEDLKNNSKALTLTGELQLHIIYSYGENGDKMESFDLNVPISHIWDYLKYDENCVFEVFLTCMNVSLEKSDDIIKENGKMLLEAEIMAKIHTYMPKTIAAATDGFSESFESEISSDNAQVFSDVDKIFLKENAEGEMPLPPDIEAITDCTCFVKSTAAIKEENVYKILCELCFHIIGVNDQGSYSSVSHNVTKSFSIDLNGYPKGFKVHAAVFTYGASAFIENGKIHFSCVLNLHGYVMSPKTLSFLTDIKILEDKPINKNSGGSITIYYADTDDNVWNIAKRYRINPQHIIDENSLDMGNFKERTAILIPM